MLECVVVLLGAAEAVLCGVEVWLVFGAALDELVVGAAAVVVGPLLVVGVECVPAELADRVVGFVVGWAAAVVDAAEGAAGAAALDGATTTTVVWRERAGDAEVVAPAVLAAGLLVPGAELAGELGEGALVTTALADPSEVVLQPVAAAATPIRTARDQVRRREERGRTRPECQNARRGPGNCASVAPR